VCARAYVCVRVCTCVCVVQFIRAALHEDHAQRITAAAALANLP
jgi:hypothetical protein